MVDGSYRLRTLDLFSGIGGISLALGPWCRTVCYCEIDPSAVGVLTKEMGRGNLDVAPVWDDIRTFGRTEIEQVGPIECVTGGFPCQDTSTAGSGAGIHGERSGLFFEIVRIIRLARPRIVFLENVSGILVRGLDAVLGELAKSGYNARWKVLSAAEVGAAHLRDRWWLVAYPDKEGLPEFISPEKGQPEGNVFNRPFVYVDWRERDPVETFFLRGVHGIPGRVDRVKCLGNSVVPACARMAFELLIDG